MIKRDINTYLFLDKRPQEFTFVYARPGYGKSLLLEAKIEEYYRRGFTVIVLSDVKDSFEFMYSMFKPKKAYHVNHLNKIGKPLEAKPVKIYHPFTFNIPKHKKLPDINFYGFSIKQLKREEWSMLAESEYESETIRLLLNASTNLNSTDGLYSFLHNIEKSVYGKKSKKGIKADPKNFYLRITTATAKGLKEVASYMSPFKKHYFFFPDNHRLNIDIKNIINDNKHYHLFTTAWVDDKKLQQFCILNLFNLIIRTVNEYAKKPILIVIPEIRLLVPERPKGYKFFLAQGMKNNLTIMRNMGRGICGLFDSQVWSDVDEAVKNTATVTYYGEIGGGNDLERLTKANRFKREIIETLKKMPYRNSYYLHGEEEKEGLFTGFFPGHCHAEPEYNFSEMYRKQFPDKLKDYSKLYNDIKKEFKAEENLMKKLNKKRESEEELSERPEKSEDVNQEVEEIKQENKSLKEKNKEDKMEKCYELSQQGHSFNHISKKVGIGSHNTVKNYIKKYKEKLEIENKKDFSEKFEESDEEVPPLGEDFELPEDI